MPPRARRHHESHHVSHVPVGSHVSRRVVVGEDHPHFYGHHRGFSLPPASGYTRIGINLGSGGVLHEGHPSDYRRLSLADTAVRHAHTTVDRVHRELANQEDPYFAALKRMPIPVEKYRSVYVPRSSSAALAGLGSVTTPAAVASHHSPSYYHYYYHREQPLYGDSYYGDSYYHRKKPLYSPISLVRCLTETPVVPVRSHSHSYEPHYYPTVLPTLTAMTSHQPAALHTVRRATSYHGPRHYRSASSYTLPESVGQWYYKAPHDPLESSFRYGSVPAVSHLSSYSVPHVRYSSPPPAYDYAVAPQPPYHSMVYTGPSTGKSSSYSYSLSGLPPLSHGYHHHHHYSRPLLSHSHVTHSPVHVTKRVYSSTSGHVPTSHVKVSDTRKKVRDVLCKVKKDPAYFDD